jgi:hypothetical protein
MFFRIIFAIVESDERNPSFAALSDALISDKTDRKVVEVSVSRCFMAAFILLCICERKPES